MRPVVVAARGIRRQLVSFSSNHHLFERSYSDLFAVVISHEHFDQSGTGISTREARSVDTRGHSGHIHRRTS